MAKKTKKEKILAELHRERQKLAMQISSTTGTPNYQFDSKPKKNNSAISKQSLVLEKPLIHTDYSYVLRDLSHTLILTVLAICAQLCVYYLLEIKHISLFNF